MSNRPWERLIAEQGSADWDLWGVVDGGKSKVWLAIDMTETNARLLADCYNAAGASQPARPASVGVARCGPGECKACDMPKCPACGKNDAVTAGGCTTGEFHCWRRRGEAHGCGHYFTPALSASPPAPPAEATRVGEFGEPWSASGTSGMVLHREQKARAVACVNALSGLNPAAVGAVIEAARAVMLNGRGRSGGSVYMTNRDQWVALRSALDALKVPSDGKGGQS